MTTEDASSLKIQESHTKATVPQRTILPHWSTIMKEVICFLCIKFGDFMGEIRFYTILLKDLSNDLERNYWRGVDPLSV